MGIESRDYIRHERRGGGIARGGGEAWAIPAIIIANVAVFVLQMGSDQVTQWLALNRDTLLSGQVWRLVTYGFCHGDVGHIFWNMLFLWFLGRYSEPVVGSREFFGFYLIGLVVSGLCHVGLTEAPVVGASGGVMATVFLTSFYFPTMEILVFLLVPVQLRYLAVIYAVIDFIGLVGAGPESVVSNAAHLGGVVWALAYRYYNLKVTTWIPADLRQRHRVRRSKLKVFAPPDSAPEVPSTSKIDFDAQVDAVLAKVAEQGEASLTEEERAVLMEASRRYKNRV